MKKYSKLISTLVATTLLAMIVLTGFVVSAQTGDSILTVGQEGLLRHLDIVIEDGPDYGSEITRGEFAMLAARVMNLPEYIGTEYGFYDVTEGTPYRNEILSLVQYGVLSGDGDGYFRPSDGITEEEASKVFSVILGYGEIGQFDGYLRTAREAGVLEGVVLDGRVTYAEALAMAYHTLQAEMLEPVTYGEERTYRVQKDYLAIERYHGLVRQTGIVEGMQYTTLIKPDINIPEGEILIGNRLFRWEDESLLGKYVVFYSKREGSSTAKDIRYIYPDENRNHIVTIPGTDVIGIRDGQLKYWVGAKEKGYKLTGAHDTIINGVAFPTATEEDLKPASGTLTLIDNNDDQVYDVIVVDAVEYMVYDTQDKENQILYGKYPQTSVGGKDVKNEIVMSGPYGQINVSTLVTGDVLRVRSSKNTTGIRKISLSRLEKCITGQVTAFLDDKITVAGNDYIINKGTVMDETVRLGETVSVYPDKNMAAVILHASNDQYQFAYLVGARNAGGGFDGKLSIRVIDQNYTLQEYQAGKTIYLDEMKYTKTDAMIARLVAANGLRVYHEDMALGEVDKNGKNDLDRMKEGDQKFPYAQPVRFRLNDAGELTHLDTIIYEADYETTDSLQPAKPGVSEIRRLAFASSPHSFYNNAGAELVFTASNIYQALRIQQVDRDDTEGFREEIIDGYYPVVEAFNLDPYNKVAKYVLVYDKAVDSVVVSNPPCIVSDIYEELDEDGNVVRRVELAHPSYSKTVVMPESITTDIGVGDVIQVETNDKGVMLAASVMFDKSLGKDQTRVVTRGGTGGYHNLYYNYRVSYGTLYHYDGNVFTHTTSVKEDLEGVEALNEFHNYRNSGTRIYVCSALGGKMEIRQGSVKDMVTYSMDRDTVQKAVTCVRRGGVLEYILLIEEA